MYIGMSMQNRVLSTAVYICKINSAVIVTFIFRNAFEQYEVLQDLFQLDPLLLPVFVHVYPKKELTNLFMYIPSYVSIAYISYMISIEEWTTARVNVIYERVVSNLF